MRLLLACAVLALSLNICGAAWYDVFNPHKWGAHLGYGISFNGGAKYAKNRDQCESFLDGCNHCKRVNGYAACTKKCCKMCFNRYYEGEVWYDDSDRMCSCGKCGRVICSRKSCDGLYGPKCKAGEAWFSDNCGNTCCCEHGYFKNTIKCTEKKCRHTVKNSSRNKGFPFTSFDLGPRDKHGPDPYPGPPPRRPDTHRIPPHKSTKGNYSKDPNPAKH